MVEGNVANLGYSISHCQHKPHHSFMIAKEDVSNIFFYSKSHGKKGVSPTLVSHTSRLHNDIASPIFSSSLTAYLIHR